MLTCDHFESVEQIYEAIGEVLESCCLDFQNSNSDKEIKSICDQLFRAINMSVINH